MRTFATLLLVGLLAACGGEPIDPDEIGIVDEIPPGPGLLTDENGAFKHVF